MFGSRGIAFFILYLAVAMPGLQISHALKHRLTSLDEKSRVTRNPVQVQEKESRTPEQKKIDSQLLYAIYQMRGEAEAKGVPTEEIKLRKDAKGRVLVDVRARVSKKLISCIEELGGKIVSTSERDHSLIAYISLDKLEDVARSKDVKFISPAAEAITH